MYSRDFKVILMVDLSPFGGEYKDRRILVWENLPDERMIKLGQYLSELEIINAIETPVKLSEQIEIQSMKDRAMDKINTWLGEMLSWGPIWKPLTLAEVNQLLNNQALAEWLFTKVIFAGSTGESGPVSRRQAYACLN